MKRPASNTSFVELHVPDFNVVKRFYGELGYQVRWEEPAKGAEGYLVLQLEGNILAFWPGTESVYDHAFFKKFPKETPRGYGVEIVVSVTNLGELYERASQLKSVVAELQTRPWGLKDFRIKDPLGYYVRFTEPDNILEATNE